MPPSTSELIFPTEPSAKSTLYQMLSSVEEAGLAVKLTASGAAPETGEAEKEYLVGVPPPQIAFIAARVRGPTKPVCGMLSLAWKRFTARSVAWPKKPVTKPSG